MAMMEVVAHLRANADNMVAGFRRAQNAAGQFGTSMNQTSAITQRGFSMMSRYAMLGATAMQGAAVAGATMGVRFAMANEQAIISFKTLLGSQQEAEQMFKDLQAFAATTPFEFGQLRDAASKLLTVGVEGERVIPIMTALGDATAAMGTGAQGIHAAVRALQQMNLVGKITGQDMMQLANAGIPAWDALAAAAGMSVAEVKKAVEKGQLNDSVQLLIKGLENYSGEAMGRVKGMMDEQSRTLTGLLSTLKDEVEIALGDMMKPATAAIKDALPAINDAVSATFKGMTEPINNMVTRMMEAFTKLIPVIQPTMIALSTIMISAIEAIVPPLVEISSVLPSLQGALEGVGEILKDVGAIVGPLVADLAVGLLPIFLELIGVVASITGFIADHEAVLATLTVGVGALVAALVAYKAVNKVWNFVGAIRDIGIMIARTLGLTAATTIQTGAEKRLAAAQAAQAAAAMGAAGAQTALNTAMLMNPVGLIIAGIMLLVAAFVILWKKFEGFRNFWKHVWNGIVDMTQVAINEVLKIYEFFVNRFVDAVNLVIKAWNAIPFTKKISEIAKVNLELDITGAKVDIIKDKTEELRKVQKKYLTDLQKANEKWDTVFAGEPKKPKEPPKPPGTDDKTLQAVKKFRDEIKRTYEQGIEKARQALQKLKDEHAEYRKAMVNAITDNVNLNNAMQAYGMSLPVIGGAVQDAIGKMLSYTDVVNSQQAAVNALEQAQKRQSEVTDEVALAQAELNKVSRKYAMTRSSKDRAAMLDEVRSASENLTKAQERLAETNKAVADAQTEADKAGKGFLDGLRKQVEAARTFAKQITDLRALGLDEAALSQIISAGAVTGGQIATELLAGGADAITKSNEMTKELMDLAKETGDAVQKTFMNTGKTAADSILDAMEEQATRAKNFAEKIKTLVGLGLSRENIQNIIDAGEEAGGMIADALIAGGSPAVQRANEIKSSLEEVASQAASLAGDAFYKAGETLAESLVKGLEAKWAELKPTLDKMTLPDLQKAATAATQDVRTTVDKVTAVDPTNIPQIQTPQPALTRDYWRKEFLKMVNKQFNKKWTKVTDYINAGVNATSKAARRKRWEDFVKANNVPALAAGGIVRATAGGTLVQVGEGGRDEAVIPLTNSILSKMGGGNTTIQVTVNAGMGTDGAEVGKQIVKILQDYERKNGRVPLRSVR